MSVSNLALYYLAQGPVVEATPPPVAGFVAWFDATQITAQSDGSALSSWPDLSGHSNTVSNTGSGRPTYWSTTGGELINGLATVGFSRTGPQFLSAPATASLSVSAASMFAVLFNGDNTSSAYGLLCNRPASPGSTTNWSYYETGNQWNGTAYTGPGYTNQAAAWMLSLTQDASNYNVWKNGTAAGGNPYANAIGSVGTYTLELGGSTQSGETFSGNIGEIIFYPSALGTTDRQAVESYLRAKWATP